jgi:hypothetical protein
MIRNVAIALAGVLVALAITAAIVYGDRADRREQQACVARGGTMKQTGTKLLPAGRGVFVPVPEYTCNGAT